MSQVVHTIASNLFLVFHKRTHRLVLKLNLEIKSLNFHLSGRGERMKDRRFFEAAWVLGWILSIPAEQPQYTCQIGIVCYILRCTMEIRYCPYSRPDAIHKYSKHWATCWKQLEKNVIKTNYHHYTKFNLK